MKFDKRILIGIIVVIVVVALYFYFRRDDSVTHSSGDMESYVTAGDMQSVGIAVPDGMVGNYELVDDINAVFPSLDSTLKATDFAELVDAGDQAIQVATTEAAHRPIERLQHLTDSYFPTIASKALPFSQAAAKPLTFHHAVNLPRVNLKGKLYQMNLSEAVRGTVPINYDPNVSLISASQFNNSDVFNPGYMTSAFNSLHDKLTGGYKSLPMYIAGSGQGTGVGGMSVEAIYDV